MSDSPKSAQSITPPGTVPLPATLDSLSARVARWPWWAIIIFVGLIMVIYLLSTNEIYRRALRAVSQNPQWTTNRIAKVLYEVRQSDGNTIQISGTLTDSTDSAVTVITRDEVQITMPRGDVGTLTCGNNPSGNGSGNCPPGQAASLVRKSASGTLIFEALGSYRVRTIFGEQEFLKIGTTSVIRNPEECVADPNGGCEITIALKPDRPENALTGQLLPSDGDSLTIETVPAEKVSIPKTDIVRTINYVPAQCAFNNIAACNEGPFLTLAATFLGFGLAIFLGLGLGIMRVSTNVVLFNLSTVYVEVIRGVPLLVILLFVGFAIEPWFHQNFAHLAPPLIVGAIIISVALTTYYGITRWTVRILEPADFIQPILISVFIGVASVILVIVLSERSTVTDSAQRSIQAAIVGLAVGYGAFLAELFRAGIQSIGKGQMEAARSLGMTYIQAMRYIILPQAFRVILPPLGNEFIAMLKDTSLIAILAVPELTQRARLFASSTYRPFETYVTIAVIYLVMTLFLSFIVRVVERRVSLPR